MRKLIIASLVAVALGASALPAAAAHVDFVVNVGAPPPPRVEIVPAPRAGWVWAPGFWEWRHGHHAWVAGHWLRHRPGYRYVPARWVLVGGHWHLRHAHWYR